MATTIVAHTAHEIKNIFRNVWSQLDGIELSLVKMKLIKIENTHCERERDGKWLVLMCLYDYKVCENTQTLALSCSSISSHV